MKKALLAALLILSLTAVLQAQSEFSPTTLLKPKTSGLFTIPPNLDARAAYDFLGERGGINTVFMPGFKAATPVPLRTDGQNFFDAMDKLSSQTGNFWFPWDSKTVVVAPNTLQDHRDFEPLIHKTVYLGSGVARETYTEIMTAARTRLQMRRIQVAPESKAIILNDTAERVTAAEQLISEMTQQSLPLPSSAPVVLPENGTIYLAIAEGGKVRRVVPSTASHMEKTLSDVSVDMNQTSRAIYENLAALAGMNVIFDHQMKDKPGARFHVEGLGLVNTLDLLALQTATIWQPLNQSTLFVMDDTLQSRRDRERVLVKVIYLPELITPSRFNEVTNMLRTSLSMRGVFQYNERKAIAMKDTPLRIFMAEKLLVDLVKDLGKPSAVSVVTDTDSYYAENGWRLGNARKARPQLEVKLRNKTTVRLNETPKTAFESLAGLAGLKVLFDKSFMDSPEIRFTATNVDVLDALDLLAWQTRQFWQVVDAHTIRVIPDAQATRREQEPMIEKTIVPADITDGNGLLNVLRTAFSFRTVSLDDKNNVLIRDTADNVALAEKFMEILGKGAAQ